MGEGIPALGPTLGGGGVRIECYEPAHRTVIAEHGGGVDVAGRDVRMSGEQRLCTLQRARGVPCVAGDARRLDERQGRVCRVGHVPVRRAGSSEDARPKYSPVTCVAPALYPGQDVP